MVHQNEKNLSRGETIIKEFQPKKNRAVMLFQALVGMYVEVSIGGEKELYMDYNGVRIIMKNIPKQAKLS